MPYMSLVLANFEVTTMTTMNSQDPLAVTCCNNSHLHLLGFVQRWVQTKRYLIRGNYKTWALDYGLNSIMD